MSHPSARLGGVSAGGAGDRPEGHEQVCADPPASHAQGECLGAQHWAAGPACLPAWERSGIFQNATQSLKVLNNFSIKM